MSNKCYTFLLPKDLTLKTIQNNVSQGIMTYILSSSVQESLQISNRLKHWKLTWRHWISLWYIGKESLRKEVEKHIRKTLDNHKPLTPIQLANNPGLDWID